MTVTSGSILSSATNYCWIIFVVHFCLVLPPVSSGWRISFSPAPFHPLQFAKDVAGVSFTRARLTGCQAMPLLSLSVAGDLLIRFAKESKDSVFDRLGAFVCASFLAVSVLLMEQARCTGSFVYGLQFLDIWQWIS